MNATAENGYLPAFTDDQLAEVARKESRKHTETIKQFCKGDFEAAEEHLDDLAQAFALGACEASKRSKDGGAVRTYQWKYGTGYMLKRMDEILSEMVQDGKNQQIDHTGGAVANGEDKTDTENLGYVLEGNGAVVNALAAEDLKAQAAKALSDLPADLQQVVNLYVVEEMTFDKIAKLLNTNKMEVYYKYHKGIEIMRRAFAA